jgi:hypothetical protein
VAGRESSCCQEGECKKGLGGGGHFESVKRIVKGLKEGIDIINLPAGDEGKCCRGSGCLLDWL